MATRQTLKQLSDSTFFDNNNGEITPSAHRTFNNTLIDFIPDPTPPFMGMKYTYLVDSNAALLAWANHAAGNDYSVVLIKSGAWSSSKGIDLTTAGTVVVVGEKGAVINFDETTKGLYYTAIPSNEYGPFILNMDINIDTSTATVSGFENIPALSNCHCTITNLNDSGNSKSFLGCRKLMNCSCSIYGDSVSSSVYTCGFYQCHKLINCWAHISAFVARGYDRCENAMNCSCQVDGGGSAYAFGFYSCAFLSNCTMDAVGYPSGYYSGCSNLLNCRAKSNRDSIKLYINCNYLVGCSGEFTQSSNSNDCAFSNCENMTGCHALMAVASGSIGFSVCINLHNCVFEATNTAVAGRDCYGFLSCKIMLGCRFLFSGSTSVGYYNCYMNKTSTSNPVADTAAGGYNGFN